MRTLFVIDMQEEYVGAENRYGYDSSSLIFSVNQRILLAQKNHEIIVYIKNAKKLRSGATVSEFADGLKVLTSYIFLKEKSSAFSNKELCQFLEDMHVTEIETIGVDGNYCVASSALDAISKGYRVVFPCKYIGINNTKRFTEKKKKLIGAGIDILE